LNQKTLADRIDADPAAREALRVGYEAGRAAHRTVLLDAATFRAAVVDRFTWRLERSGLDPTPGRITPLLGTTCFADLYLTVACDVDRAGAWTCLLSTYAPRIDGLARSIGLGQRARGIGNDVLADLTAPPSAGRARTRIGLYDGSGSLFAWLAVVLRRREISRSRRRAQPKAVGGSVEWEAEDVTGNQDPFCALANAEEAAQLLRALQAAWATLATREQLAIHYKYGEVLKQRDIARLLGLSESRVSRVIRDALEKLRTHVAAPLTTLSLPVSRLRLWAALWHAVKPAPNDTLEVEEPRD